MTAPATSSMPHDLTHHACINLRLPTLGGLYALEFGKDGRELNVRVDGQLVFNEMAMILKAATEGFGLAFVLEDKAAPLIADAAGSCQNSAARRAALSAMPRSPERPRDPPDRL